LPLAADAGGSPFSISASAQVNTMILRGAYVFGFFLAAIALPCHATLVTSHTDTSDVDGATVNGSIGVGEYNGFEYIGGGTGFGGPLGSGRLYFESNATTLFVGADIAGGLGSNIIAVFLDSRSGGFSSDATMGDTADGGRAVASKLTRDVQDNFPIAADFVLEFGNGFTNVFELTTGSLNFIAPTSAGTGGNAGAGSREASIPLATLGLNQGSTVGFFAVLISDTQFSSNEGIPATGFGANPGFGTGGPVTWPNHHNFVVAVPEASPLLFGAAVCALAGAWRWGRSFVCRYGRAAA
jgi:hypothetical protein